MKLMKVLFTIIAASMLMFTACGDSSSKADSSKADSSKAESSSESSKAESSAADSSKADSKTDSTAEQKQTELTMQIGETKVDVKWEDNESVMALRELAKDKPLTVQMSKYGGFEQVGSLGSELPSDDVQTQTEAGDIVLYSGSKIVVFYGSNSWEYTRLGRITDKSAEELTELLGGDDITLTLSYQ